MIFYATNIVGTRMSDVTVCTCCTTQNNELDFPSGSKIP